MGPVLFWLIRMIAEFQGALSRLLLHSSLVYPLLSDVLRPECNSYFTCMGAGISTTVKDFIPLDIASLHSIICKKHTSRCVGLDIFLALGGGAKSIFPSKSADGKHILPGKHCFIHTRLESLRQFPMALK